MERIEAAAWTDEDRALWARIAAHDFEPAGAALTFAGRLARDHGWSLTAARAAIDEYRRFCFLALRAGAEATPSEEVDEVWHLHLAYTRDYWLVWCRDVLRRDLHHGPTLGGAVESRRFAEQYAGTLAAYEAWFGPPPPGLWPGTAERFGRPRFRMVDSASHLMVPLPRRVVVAGRRLARSLSLGAVFASLSAGPASAMSLGVLDWTAEAFLVFYVTAGAISLLAAYVLPLLVPSAVPANPRQRQWEPVELGLLAGGRQRAADVLTLEAVAAGDATIEASGIVVDGRMLTRPDLLRDLSTTIDGVQGRLAEQGFALSLRRARVSAAATITLILPVIGLGAAKIIIGSARHKDVGWLCFFVLATAIAGLLIACKRTPASRVGRSVLSDFKRDHPRVMRAPTSQEVLTAFACVGAAALWGTPLESYAGLIKPAGEGSGCGGDGGGGGGGCGGCGGCGGS